MTSAEQLWDLFAGHVAGDINKAGKVSARVWRDGTYQDRRRLDSRPTAPAAVLLYDREGRTRCLALDFDSKGPGGVAAAMADATVCEQLIRACGGRVVVDSSISGGRHVYVPLQRARSIDQVRGVMAGLSARFRTLDKTPMLNPRTGAIRPPGAAHPRGGYQQLVTALDDAVATFRTGNGDGVWTQLCAALGPVDLVPGPRGRTTPLVASTTRWRGRKRPLTPEYEAIARTGAWDRSRHPKWTASEARQAVLASAYNAGWLLGEVQAQMVPAGLWQGLRRLYGRRPLASILPWEWSRAETLILKPSGPDVRRSPTREPSHAAGGKAPHSEYAWLREWWTAMRLTERRRYAGRDGHSTRLVLRALAAAAQRRGSRYVAFGVRSLALASNLDHTTVARALRELREEDDPLVDLVESKRGHDRADIYALRVPDEFARQARRAPWRPGRLESVHHAFLELGVPAAFVYEALGERAEPLMTVDVADVSMLGRTAATQALKTLAELGLAERGPGGWRRGPISLDQVAEQLGTREEFERRVAAYRTERLAYRKKISRSLVEREARELLVSGPPVDLWSVEVAITDERDEDVIELPADSIERAVAKQLGARLVSVGVDPDPRWRDVPTIEPEP